MEQITRYIVLFVLMDLAISVFISVWQRNRRIHFRDECRFLSQSDTEHEQVLELLKIDRRRNARLRAMNRASEISYLIPIYNIRILYFLMCNQEEAMSQIKEAIEFNYQNARDVLRKNPTYLNNLKVR